MRQKYIYTSNYSVCLIKWSYFKYLKHFPLYYLTMECYGKERLKLWVTYAEFLLLQQLNDSKIFFSQPLNKELDKVVSSAKVCIFLRL